MNRHIDIQSGIAETIAAELNAVITPLEKQLLTKPLHKIRRLRSIPEGSVLLENTTTNDLDTAMQYFEMAKEKDPDYALAYAGIGDVWVGRQQGGNHPLMRQGRRHWSHAKALEIDSTRAEVHYTLGTYQYVGNVGLGGRRKSI